MSREIELVEALRLSNALIAEAHGILARYLQHGLTSEETVQKLLTSLSGRKHLEQMRATKKAFRSFEKDEPHDAREGSVH